MSKSQLNFAPYSAPPDAQRAQQQYSDDQLPSSSSATASAAAGGYHSGAPVSSLGGPPTSFGSSQPAGGRQLPSEFDGSGWSTSTGFRHDYEAAFAYLLGPFSAAILLVFETTNDFVRFHAWQSAFASGALVVLHLVLYLIVWRWVQYALFAFDIVLMAGMALRSYRDSDLLDRYHLPYVGAIADKWVSEE